MISLLCVLLCLITHFSVGSTAAWADALPEDTNKIESLTPEQARKLAEEFPGVEVEFEAVGAGRRAFKYKLKSCLPLNGLKKLAPDVARALARYCKKGSPLLNGLTAIDADTAKALAEFKCGWLHLSGLTTLDAATAKALAEFKGGVLALNGLTTLDAATAEALAEFKGWGLALNGLTTLDANTAEPPPSPLRPPHEPDAANQSS